MLTYLDWDKKWPQVRVMSVLNMPDVTITCEMKYDKVNVQ